MEQIKVASILSCIVLVFITTTNSFPAGKSASEHTQTDTHLLSVLKGTPKDSSGDTKSQKSPETIRDAKKSHDDHVINDRAKRDVTSLLQLDINNNSTDEATFEKYEREYLMQQIEKDLRTLYYQEEYKNYLNQEKTGGQSDGKDSGKFGTSSEPPSAQPTGPDFNRVDPILDAKLRELRNLSNRDLDRIFDNVHRAVEDGVQDTSIARLCCQMTG